LGCPNVGRPARPRPEVPFGACALQAQDRFGALARGKDWKVNISRRGAWSIMGAAVVLMVIALLADLNAMYSRDLRAALVVLIFVAYGTIVVLVKRGIDQHP
jgi:hypothetical protein